MIIAINYGHTYLGQLDEFKDWTEIQKSEKVFRICYKLYLENSIICLYEFSSYYNSKILH